ncbi:16098_t:CDS:2 [Funneliformis mosseae]|uniref:16098_t:CDS:1 n=1 Tax=Funneliformis mosseae TaxID=27381 RepID=A0A9N9ALF2_FUNMO|nr:16098_t:CDS:2 [Funneliformis mosseae]
MIQYIYFQGKQKGPSAETKGGQSPIGQQPLVQKFLLSQQIPPQHESSGQGTQHPLRQHSPTF